MIQKIPTYLFVVLTAFSLHASDRDVPKLTLSASASIRKPADELQMKIGVVTLAETAEEALSDNNRKMQQVILNLYSGGIDKDDYETSQFSINPTYSPYPQNPPLNWRPSIVGYEVTNTLLIATKKLGLAGEIIDLANLAGANTVSDIRFGLHSPRDYWTEALTAAGSNAIKDAQAIAAATGVKLIRVLSISLNHTQVKSPHLSLACLANTDGIRSSPPIEPGEVSIEATVSLVYEIN